MSPGVIETIRSVFQSTGIQVAGSLGTLVGLVLFGYLVLRAGRPLKRRFDGRVVELLQAAVMLAVTGLAGTVIVVAWRATDEVRQSFYALDFGVNEAVLLVVTVLIVFGSYSLTVLVKRLVDTFAHQRDAFSRHQQEIAYHVLQVGIYVFAALFALSVWGIDLGNLLLGAGVLGIVLGLAARQTLGAVLAGFVLLFSRPFAIGDWVQINDREGYVVDVTIFNTEIRTFDDEHVVIPNDIVTGSSIVNRSRRGQLRIDVEVSVDYDADPREAATVAREAMEAVDGVAESPPPKVVLKEFESSAIVLECRFYIRDPTAEKRWTTQTGVVAAVSEAFDEAGIKIPFPQRELVGRDEAGGFEITAASDLQVTRSETDGDVASDGDGTATDEDHDTRTGGDGDPNEETPASEEE